ncbi:hypothetical protein [Halovenus marina]|uniref:hypothetical protein n=1 Tax=Halovenus marina TaxID=3396621 RepID=UPI003F54B4AE
MSPSGVAGDDQSGKSRLTWLAVVGFGIVLGLVVILLRTPAASGYEPSMYAPYPTSFWVLVVVAFTIGQYIIIKAALSRNLATANWQIGFLLTVVIAGLLVFMPYIRGYPIYGRADVMTHIGSVLEIQASGGEPFQNIYQNIHQLVLALSYATGLEPSQVINSVGGIISVFSIVASYALVATVFDRRRALLTLPFVVALIGGRAYMNPSPYAQSVLMLPFVLYLFVKSQQAESFATRLPLSLFVIALILYHPLTAVFLIFIFLIHHGVTIVSNRGVSSEHSLAVSSITSGTTMQLSLVVFVAWYYNFVGIILRFETVFQRLLDPGTSQTKLDTYSATINQFSPSLTDLMQIALVKYGETAVLLGIGSLFVLGLFGLYLRGRRPSTPYLLTFGLGFVLFSAFGVLFMIVDMIGGFGRPLMVAQYFGAFVAGSLLYWCYRYFDWQSGVTTVATVVLIALVAISVFGLYYSSAGGESNFQVSDHELTGAEWYFDNDLDTEPLQEQGIRMYRFEHALNGSESENVPQDGTRPPNRFNYTEYSTFGESYNETQYYVLTEQARVFYPTVYPNYEHFWSYRQEDFARLPTDPTVSHVYDNGEFDIYRIEPPAGS